MSQLLHGQEILQWSVYLPDENVWVEIGPRGSVQELYKNTKRLPDPVVGTNETLYQWMEEEDWHFKCEFQLTAEQLSRPNLKVHFPNIDTYAELYLNGEHLGSTNSCFRPWTFDLKQHGKVGNNILSVYFESPVEHHRSFWEAKDFRLPAPNDVHEVAIAPYTRKPQYQFGWDWSMRMNTIGFWYPAFIEANSVNIRHARINTESIQGNRAMLSLNLEICGLEEDVMLRSKRFGDYRMSKNQSTIHWEVQQDEVELWWPVGHGPSKIYTDSIWLETTDGRVVAQQTLTYGIRQSELRQEKDSIGTSYEIVINDRPIFCKGANVIPPTVFPGSEGDSSWLKLVDHAVAANFNMLRIWGGGYYPPDAFYDYCDEKGILIWQDFMFACAMYPGDKEFLDLLKPELNEQIPRLSAHPSVVLFNGNNEVNVAWKNWGFQVQYLLGRKAQKQIESWYQTVFQELIPNTLTKHEVRQPYIHTSPLSNWGKIEDFNHGSQHYWGVWHGKDPLEGFVKKSGRFNAEYGFQSFPQISVVSSFADSSQWRLDSEVMKHHQKSYVGNQMIEKHAKRLYGASKDFEEFVVNSQRTQSKAVSMAVSAHRLQAPRCMGTIYWQLNDCWPAPTWSSVDAHGHWKLLHHQMKEDMRDVGAVSLEQELGKEQVFMSNIGGERFVEQVHWWVYDLEGTVLREEKIKADLNYLDQVMLLDLNKEYPSTNVVMKVEWRHGEELHHRLFSHLPNERAPCPKDAIQLEVFPSNLFNGQIKIKTSSYIQQLVLVSKMNGLHFEENNLDVLPGQRVINYNSTRPVSEPEIQLFWK